MKATLSYLCMVLCIQDTFMLNLMLYKGKFDLSKIKAYIWLKIILKRP